MHAGSQISDNGERTFAIGIFGEDPAHDIGLNRIDGALPSFFDALDDVVAIALAARYAPGFDAPDLPIKLHKEIPNGVHPGAGVTTGSNPEAKEMAYKEMLEFLERHLR